MLNDLFLDSTCMCYYRSPFRKDLFKGMMKESPEGTDTMKNIAGHVRKGAMAYLRQQYQSSSPCFSCFMCAFCLDGLRTGLQNPWVWFAFLTGGFFFRIGRV